MPDQQKTTEANKALVRRFIDEVFVQGSVEVVGELVTDDFAWHASATPGAGREALEVAIRRVSAALAEREMTIHDVFAEDDRVAVRLSSHAVHVGEFMGVEPTGKPFTIGEIHVFRIRDGRVAEHWQEGDVFGMLDQLGALHDHGPDED